MREPAAGAERSRGTPSDGQPVSLSRRALIGGAVPVTPAAIGAVATMATQLSPVVEAPTAVAPAEPEMATPLPPAATPPATPVTSAVQPAQPGPPTAARELTTVGVPEGMALVASPRLALSGVGPEDPWRLLNGSVATWAEVGAALPWPVRPLALQDEVAGVSAAQTFATYDELAAALATDIGGVALVPVDAVDFRVQTLLIGGEDPLLAAGGVPVRIGVVGDIVPGRNVHLHMQQYGDFTRPFQRIAPLLASFDVMVANLEGNLSATLPQPADPHSVTFVSDPAMLEGFALAGIDAVTLANNHSVWNGEGWGVQGLLDTIDALDDYGVPYFGAGADIAVARAPWLVTANGITIAFLGIDGVTANYEVEPGVPTGVLDFNAGAGADHAGTNPYLAAQLATDVAAATAVADVVIPYFHLGAEYVAVPPPWAVEATHLAIDAGAAMVVTNHPHLIQGMETYAGKPIVYSPGNFILDQMWAVEVRSGYVLEVVLRGTKVAGLRFHGVEIEDFHQPRQMASGEQAALMDRFWAATDRLAARSRSVS